MHKSKVQQPAFTLLELSVVLLLMTIMLGFSLPMFSNFFESTLRKETQKIAKIIGDLRMQAILQNESYQLVFDSKKSEYSVYSVSPTDSQKTTPHQRYSSPIALPPPIQFVAITSDTEVEIQSKFGFKKLEFDKIFGKSYQFRIDSSGFIDLFTLRLKDNKNSISLTIRNIMGDITIGQEQPL